MRYVCCVAVCLLILCICTAPGTAAQAPPTEHYVSPTGTPTGAGTIADPWDLATALSHPAPVQPGDTIWLRGGTYRFQTVLFSVLTGTQAAPIIVRQYPGERATIDFDAPPAPIWNNLTLAGAWTWYWGFEVTNSHPVRFTEPNIRHGGVGIDGRGTRAINLIVHDGAGCGT